jgi:ABC transport system ATP-binding/permease protein
VYIVVVEDERGALISEHALFDGQLTLGRTPENDVVLPGGAVSRQHAEVFLEGMTAYVRDLGSSNGVLVNDQRVREATPINESSQVRIGEYRLFLERATGKLKPSQAGINTAILHPEQAHGKLVVAAGNGAGREYLLFDPIVCIGRTDENDITLADVSVSRHHARLKRQDDGGYVLTDLSSSNGTLLQSRRVVQSARAWHGDRVQFGNVDCILVDPKGKGRSRRGSKQYLVVGLLVLGAAVLGALVSLLLVG